MTLKEEKKQGYSHGSEGGQKARLQPWLYRRKGGKDTTIALKEERWKGNSHMALQEARIQP